MNYAYTYTFLISALVLFTLNVNAINQDAWQNRTNLSLNKDET